MFFPMVFVFYHGKNHGISHGIFPSHQVEELRSGFVEVFVASLADLASEVELFVSEAATTVVPTVEGAGSGWKTQ